MDKRKMRVIGVVVAVGIILLALIAVILLLRGSGDPIPTELRGRAKQTVGFPVFYPQRASADKNFKYVSGSARQEEGVLFFALKSQNGTINVSQQAVPAQPPDLKNIIGFKMVDLPYGLAAIGRNKTSPTIVIIADTTLITATGPPPTTSADVIELAKSLQPIR